MNTAPQTRTSMNTRRTWGLFDDNYLMFKAYSFSIDHSQTLLKNSIRIAYA